ncbi:MAG: AIM24 family protein, partial [Candidatus Onthovivens sp.]
RHRYSPGRRKLMSGECLVCRFRGPGVVLIQTRNPDSFVKWLEGMLPKNKG